MKVQIFWLRRPVPGPRWGWAMSFLLPLLLLLLAGSAFASISFASKCPKDLIQCYSSDTCIPKSSLCDGNDDCSAAEDESTAFCSEYQSLTSPCPAWKVFCNNKCVPFNKACKNRKNCGATNGPSFRLCWTMLTWKFNKNYLIPPSVEVTSTSVEPTSTSLEETSTSLQISTLKRRPDLNSTTGFATPVPNAAFNIFQLKENPLILRLRDSSPRKEGDQSRSNPSRIQSTPPKQDETPLIRATPFPQRRFAIAQAVASSGSTRLRPPTSPKLTILQFINSPPQQTPLTASDLLTLQTPELLSSPEMPTSQTPERPTLQTLELLTLQELHDQQTRTSPLVGYPTTADDGAESVLPSAGWQTTADRTALQEPSCCAHCLRCAVSSSCIAHTQICDGVVDCPAWEDENPDLCKHFTTVSCPAGLATCDSSCLPWASACAGLCREQAPFEACYVVLKRQIPASYAQESHQEDTLYLPQNT